MHSPPAPAKMRAMSDVAQILSGIEQGDPKAAEELLPLVYHELRQLGAAHGWFFGELFCASLYLHPLIVLQKCPT